MTPLKKETHISIKGSALELMPRRVTDEMHEEHELQFNLDFVVVAGKSSAPVNYSANMRSVVLRRDEAIKESVHYCFDVIYGEVIRTAQANIIAQEDRMKITSIAVIAVSPIVLSLVPLAQTSAVPIGHVSKGDLQKAWNTSGGLFQSNIGGHGKGSYGCSNLDNGSEVICSGKGSCQGYSSSVRAPKRISGIKGVTTFLQSAKAR